DPHVLIVLVGLWVELGATLALVCVLVWVAATYAPRVAVLGIGAYLIILFAALEVIPWSFQSLIVEPNELELETPFLQFNIALTRASYGLDKIDVRIYPTGRTLVVAQMRYYQESIYNIFFWDQRTLGTTF